LDFFDGKGVVETLLQEIAVKKIDFKPFVPQDAPHLQGGRAASIYGAKKHLGWIGEVHPKVAANFEIDVPVVAFELDMSTLEEVANDARPYREIPQFPPVQYDIALLVDKKLTAKEILRTIESAGGSLLYDVKLFDIFEDDEKLGADKKSMAFSLEYRAAERTLTSEEVEKTHTKLLEKVTKATAATLR
jgi:phenylalanyl-tRNA synthetase beta chain